MINTRMIRARMCERGDDVYGLASFLGKSYGITLSKLNGKSNLTLNEAERWQQFLSISDEDFCVYFMRHDREQ